MSRIDRTDMCYQHDSRQYTLTTPTVAATPIRNPMRRVSDGAITSRRKYKEERTAAKSLRRKMNGSQ